MFDCAIIGAGLAGLVAADDLRARGLSVVVLEARDRVGGRVENAQLASGSYVEMGGQWIGPGFDALLELVHRFELETVGVPSQGGRFIVRAQGNAVAVPAEDETPSLNPFEVADLGQGLLRLRRLARRFRDDAAWTAANHVWLEQSLHRWAHTNIRTKKAQERFEDVYRAAFGELTDETTLRNALENVADGPDLETMLATNGKLQQLRVKGGSYTLTAAMAEDLGDIVRLGAVVTKVRHSADEATVVLADGEEVRARHVISTLPPRLATALEHDPPLPAWRAEAADKVSPGNVIKAHLLFETPFWRERGLSGQSSADEGAVRVTFDTTPEDSEGGQLMGFFSGSEADSLSKRTPTIRERAFLDSVKRSFGQDIPKPVAYIERNWAAEEFSGGCHGAHFTPGIWTTVGPGLAEPEGVLHWAGAEYAAKFNGYMEGAVRSGLSAAAAVASQSA